MRKLRCAHLVKNKQTTKTKCKRGRTSFAILQDLMHEARGLKQMHEINRGREPAEIASSLQRRLRRERNVGTALTF